MSKYYSKPAGPLNLSLSWLPRPVSSASQLPVNSAFPLLSPDTFHETACLSFESKRSRYHLVLRLIKFLPVSPGLTPSGTRELSGRFEARS